MKEPSALVPQGSFESQAQRKSHVRIAVFAILALHVVVLGGLLILGCKRDDNKDKDNSVSNPPTNEPVVQPFVETPPTNVPPLTNVVVVPPTNTTPINIPVPGAPIEHTIAKGDNFATL